MVNNSFPGGAPPAPPGGRRGGRGRGRGPRAFGADEGGEGEGGDACDDDDGDDDEDDALTIEQLAELDIMRASKAADAYMGPIVEDNMIDEAADVEDSATALKDYVGPTLFLSGST